MRKITAFAAAAILGALLFGEPQYYNGKGGEGKSVMVSSLPVQNSAGSADSFLPAKLRENIVAGLSRYGGFDVIDLAEARNVADMQRQLESAMYSDEKMFEMGRMETARNVVTVRATRLPSGSYTASVAMYDIESGKTKASFSSTQTFDSAESCALLAHFECVQYLIVQLEVVPTEVGKSAIAAEKSRAEKESVAVKERKAAADKRAQENAAASAAAKRNESLQQIEIQRKQFELSEEIKDAQTRREREQREYERAEAKRAAEEAEEQRKKDEAEFAAAAQRRAEKKAQNPFYGEVYTAAFENGALYDTYEIAFTSPNDCTIRVTSLDRSNNATTVTAKGSYSYSDTIFSLDAVMRDSTVKHVQSVHWKSVVLFKNGYNTAVLSIPVSSRSNAKRTKTEFQRKTQE